LTETPPRLQRTMTLDLAKRHLPFVRFASGEVKRKWRFAKSNVIVRCILVGEKYYKEKEAADRWRDRGTDKWGWTGLGACGLWTDWAPHFSQPDGRTEVSILCKPCKRTKGRRFFLYFCYTLGGKQRKAAGYGTPWDGADTADSVTVGHWTAASVRRRTWSAKRGGSWASIGPACPRA
jgi:hypothetical protein